MAKKNKTYILTIEYNENEDQLEYIQEEIIEPSEFESSRVVGSLLDEDYWNKDSLDIIRKFYTGVIGES